MDATREGSLSSSDLGSVQEPAEDVPPPLGKTQKGVCGCRLLQIAVCAAPHTLLVVNHRIAYFSRTWLATESFLAGGPPRVLTARITNVVGAKASPITYGTEGQQRRAMLPGVLNMTVAPLPRPANPNEPMPQGHAHPLVPELTQAYGERTSYLEY